MEMYSQNNRGPRIKPWGTPELKGVEEEVKLSQ